MKQSFCYLINHDFGRFFRELHEAVFDDVVDEEVDVSRDALLIRELLHGLLDEVRLRVHEVADVVYHLGVQLLCLSSSHLQRHLYNLFLI